MSQEFREYTIQADFNYEDIQNNKLFQKFMKTEEIQKKPSTSNLHKPKESVPKPKINIKKQFPTQYPEKQEIPNVVSEEETDTPIRTESRVNFNPSFEPSYHEFQAQQNNSKERQQRPREIKQWKQQSPERDNVNESSIYNDFAQLAKYSPEVVSRGISRERTSNTKIQQPEQQQKQKQMHQYEMGNVDESLFDDKMKTQNLFMMNHQQQLQIDRQNQTVNDLRKKALEENHKFQDLILTLNDRIQNLQEKIYELQKSEDFLQLENDRLKVRCNQENLLRTKIEEDQKDLQIKNIELSEKTVQLQQQMQRLREENIHLRSQNDQFKGDTLVYKQQIQSLQDRNIYMEQQMRSEIQKKDMIQSQNLDAQDRIHRAQIDQETFRSEMNDCRRIQQEQQQEIEALKRQLNERRSYSQEKNRQYQSMQSQIFQANQTIESLKNQLNQTESQLNLHRSNQYMKTIHQDPYVNTINSVNNFNMEDSNIVLKDSNFYSQKQDNYPNYKQDKTPQRTFQAPVTSKLDTSYDQYQKYQQAQRQSSQTQAQQGGQQGGQRNIKEKEIPIHIHSGDKEIKDSEQQLLNSQLQKTQIMQELKQIENSKVRTGANIRKKGELEKQIVQVESKIVQYRNKLREMNALIN